MTYTDAVLADGPWAFWKCDEASGTTLADATGNARPMTLSGTVTKQVAGPDGQPGMSFATGAYGISTVKVATSPVTYELWFKVDAFHANGTWLMGTSDGYGGLAHDKDLWVTSGGKIAWYVAGNDLSPVTSSNTVALGEWHHLVVSCGAAGQKIRLDKVTVGSGGTTTTYNGAMNVLIHDSRAYGASPPHGGGGAASVALVAAFTQQLTDAQTDAHYDAASGLLSGTVAGTLPPLEGSFTATYTPPPPSGTIVGALPGLTGSFNAVVPVEGAFSGVLPALTGAMEGSSYPITGTDDTYANEGYNYAGVGRVDYTPPIAPTPARVRRSKVQHVHQSLPAPTLENGRPV